jgi:hypothetical protein
MNFKDLLSHLVEESRAKADSFRTTGEAIKKERMVGGATDRRAKDAARKRAERSKQIPRSQRSKDELVKEVIAVQTSGGSVQLIFKDSFDKSKHTKINKTDKLSVEEAKSYTKDPKFEQTGASKLLFGDVKQREPSEKQEKQSKEEKPEVKAKEAAKQGEEDRETATEEKPEGRKAKKMSKEDIFNMMTQMSPEQLAQVPIDVRQQYFMQTRNPPTNTAFDSLSFEKLSTMFGINTLTSTPYNQQVINALIFLAKVKAGATEQEIQSYAALAPTAFDFTKIAFSQARKILSQLGDQCIQGLVSSIEAGSQSTNNEGAVDMECGEYRFKISAGGEFLLTTDKFDQKSKTFRGLITTAIGQALADPSTLKDPKMQSFAKNVEEASLKFSTKLLSKDAFDSIKRNPEILSQLQNTPILDSEGNKQGMMVDEKGNLNKLASFENYKTAISKHSASLFKNNAKNPSEFVDNFMKNVLKMYYRGDMLRDPKVSPTHLVTQNGIFQMSDDYFNEIAKTSSISMKAVKREASVDNISKRIKPSELLNRYTTVVEGREPKKKASIDDLFIDKSTLNPVQLALTDASHSMDFDINVSLLPGFSPKDLNVVQYNYVTIGNKTIKIPVEKTDLLALELQENIHLIANDLLVESLSNNFVLNKLVNSYLLTDEESRTLSNPGLLVEDNVLKLLYQNLIERASENPKLLLYVLNSYNSELYEKYVRDYKKEYRNYHGKAKQRKERAKRTSARERLIKKGKVKKGSKMDVDHKNPLRNGGSNGINNLRLRHRSDNRSDNGHRKGEKQNKDWK